MFLKFGEVETTAGFFQIHLTVAALFEEVVVHVVVGAPQGKAHPVRDAGEHIEVYLVVG